MELSEKWAGRSRADKIREIRSKLKEKGADLFILNLPLMTLHGF